MTISHVAIYPFLLWLVLHYGCKALAIYRSASDDLSLRNKLAAAAMQAIRAQLASPCTLNADTLKAVARAAYAQADAMLEASYETPDHPED